MAPIALPHSEGGFLTIAASERFEMTVRAEMIHHSPESSDMIRVTKVMCDAEGIGHRFVTVFSAYDLWDRVSCSENWLDPAFRKSWHSPQGASRLPLVGDLQINEDGRGYRVFSLRTDISQSLLFQGHEHRFYAIADLFLLRKPPSETGYQAEDWFYSKITLHQGWEDSTEKFELNIEDPIIVPIPRAILLFENQWTEIEEDGDPVWVRSEVPIPISVTRCEIDSSPQSSVTWKR